jgi:diamine N-acetyltransferase
VREVGYYFLWRLMIDAAHQRRGYGRRAVECLIIEHVRSRPHATRLPTSRVAGEGSPEGFYRGLGFRPTGEEPEGELKLERSLEGP